jgi:hypothetical protein
MSRSRFFSGLPLILFGLLAVFYVFAFMSMIDPALEGEKWWRELAWKYLHSKEALFGTLLGLVFVAAGPLLWVKAFARQQKSDGI